MPSTGCVILYPNGQLVAGNSLRIRSLSVMWPGHEMNLLRRWRWGQPRPSQATCDLTSCKLVPVNRARFSFSWNRPITVKRSGPAEETKFSFFDFHFFSVNSPTGKIKEEEPHTHAETETNKQREREKGRRREGRMEEKKSESEYA